MHYHREGHSDDAEHGEGDHGHEDSNRKHGLAAALSGCATPVCLHDLHQVVLHQSDISGLESRVRVSRSLWGFTGSVG